MDQSNRRIFGLLTNREVSQAKIFQCPDVLKFLLRVALLRLDRLHHLSCSGIAGASFEQVLGSSMVLLSTVLTIILLTYWTILGRHQTVALHALSLHCIELLSAEVEVGLVHSSLGHLATGGDGIGAVSQGGEGFQCRVWNTKTLPPLQLRQ